MESPQYHHFVPQFLLKNFAHKYKPPKRTQAPTSKNGKTGKKLYRGDLVVNYLDLTSSNAEFEEIPVKRALGQTDMYRDTSKPLDEQQHIEQMLSRLESDASAVFRKITDAHSKDMDGVILTRNERNLVRKFLFIMKYRCSRFHLRFYHDVATDYYANDRERLLEYMREKNFTNPMEVWFDNIKAFINLDMDEELNWISELPKRIYPDDAMWAINHCQFMYMAFCTPSKAEDEFIVTDNSYHIYEGPSSFSFYANAGVGEETAWVNFHEFAPVSPKLIIILRSNLLPQPLEDANPSLKRMREKQWSLVVKEKFGDTNSILADLPIRKALNNYSEIVNERLRLLPGEDGSLRSDHKFDFTFFPIDSNHVHKINALFFDNSSSCNGIVYNSKQSFRNALEWYLTEPCQVGKRVVAVPRDPHFQCLIKLAAVLKKMGSDAKPVWEEISPPKLTEEQITRIQLAQMRKSLPSLLEHLPDEPTEFMQIYNSLGGSKKTIARDLEQSELMMKLRIKIDVWSQGIDQRIRQRNREYLIHLFRQFPRRRLWYYLKRWRVMVIRGPDPPHRPIPDDAFDGPEDIVAQCGRATKSGLNDLMFYAARNDIKLIEMGLCGSVKLEMEYSRRRNIKKPEVLIFQENVAQCGIKELEDLAISFQTMAYNRWHGDAPAKELYIELETRKMVKRRFKEVLRDRVEDDILDQFKTIFFESIYPIPEDNLGGRLD